MRFILAAFLFFSAFVSTVSFADQLHITIKTLQSDRIDGVRPLVLHVTDKEIMVSRNPNHCGNPGPCTHMSVRSELAEAKTVSDHRANDGELTVQLTKDVQLLIGADNDMTARVQVGNGSVQLLHMTPVIDIEVTQPNTQPSTQPAPESIPE